MSEFPPAPGLDSRREGHDNSSTDASLDAALLDAVSEAFSAAFIVYDRHDHLIFASRSARQFLPLPSVFFNPGTRLRDVLGAAYDAGLRQAASGEADAASLSREEWLARQIAAHWKERSELQASDDGKRWTRFSKRRLSSGFGFCVMSDITEQRRREEQWRADVERVQLTEEILDNLAHPVFVQDRNLHLVAVNKIFCSAVSIGADNALGGSITGVFEPEVAARLAASSRHVLETGLTSSVTIPMRLYGDPPRPILVHVQRVGKPGRYLVVASLGEVGVTSEIALPAAEYSASSHQTAWDYGEDGRLTGRKALLVTADREFETRALEILQLLGLDSCCVRDDQELDAFLSVAKSVGVTINLAIVDTDLDMRCLELLQAVDVDYITLPSSEIAGDLAFSVLDRMTALQTPPLPTDDWEITTDDVSETAISTASAKPEGQHGSSAVTTLNVSQSPSLVLVAEDNEINQIVFSQILEGLGYAYKLCADGETAVRLWSELKPAIVLMDVTLPGINGFEAARRIRQMPQEGMASTPIIGVLAQAFDRDREACFASGMDEVILKPLSPDVVDQAIRRHVSDMSRLVSTA